MSRFAAYCRVSTSIQASEGVSIDAQQTRLRAWASAFGHDVREVITDAGESGKDLDRPGMQRVIAMLEAGEVEGVVIYDLSRLTRSVRDLVYLVERYFTDRYQLVSLSEAIDTKSAAGRMMLQLMGIFAEWYRASAAEKTRDALRHMKKSGVRLGRAPFGYSHANVQGKRVMIPIPAEQEVMALCQEWADSGLTLREMASELMLRQIPARDGGLRWWSSSVACVMRTLREVQNSHGALRVSEAQGILQGN